MTREALARARFLLNGSIEGIVAHMAETLDQVTRKEELIKKLSIENDELKTKIQELEQQILELEDEDEVDSIH